MVKSDYIKQYHRFQMNRELYFTPKIKKALKAQYKMFADSYVKTGDVERSLRDVQLYPIYTVLKTLYIDAGTNYGSLVYSQLPKAPKRIKRRAPIGFNQEITDLINSYFEGEILNFSEEITDTTRGIIRVVMQIAIEEGRSFDWIEENLVEECIDLKPQRARLIARTETNTASNQAAYFAAAKTGLLMKKEWLSAGDNRVRPDHQHVNGDKVDMEGYFTVGDSKMLIPGARVQENGLPTPAKEVCNCRCVALYEPQRYQGRLVEFDYGIWQGGSVMKNFGPAKKLFVTDIKAVDPDTGNIVEYAGPLVAATDIQAANEYCQANGLGYCSVSKQFVGEIPE